jgi:hypothetical protein
MEDIIAIIGVFGCGAAAIIAFSPIGKAIAEGMRARRGLIANEDVEDLRAELQGVREQLSELAERQDFAERLLAQQRDKGLVGPAKDAS